jgi:hypothetical protein
MSAKRVAVIGEATPASLPESDEPAGDKRADVIGRKDTDVQADAVQHLALDGKALRGQQR